MKEATVSKIRIYPIKSLGHVELKEVEMGMHALKKDRQFAMVDENNRYLNGKRNWKVNQLKTNYNLDEGTVTFFANNKIKENSFELREGNTKLDSYLSSFFESNIRLLKNDRGEFLDIPKESSLTVVSESSLNYIREDKEKYSLENMRLRFRSNIELSSIKPFWEEKLYKEPGIGIHFKIGDVNLIGVSPRARCNVPPQDPNTGEMDYYFIKNMMNKRATHKPTLDKILKFGSSTYFLAVNVYLPREEMGKRIKLRDRVEILGEVELS